MFTTEEENDRAAVCCVQEVVLYGGGTVMVWRGICGQERTPLVIVNGNFTAQRYIDDILLPTVLPFSQRTAVLWCHLLV